jgi:lipoprotein-anchoring transpeptidase ErfK/SrfK
MSRHRGDVRPRYGRIVALASSVTVSSVAGLAGLGVLASGAQAGPSAQPGSYHRAEPETTRPATDHLETSDAADLRGSVAPLSGTTAAADAAIAAALPANSGQGRRIVFSEDRQRVWLVGGASDNVRRTYLVSGSVTDNLQPGTYSVYSKSRWAVGVDDSGVMQYFVRFTEGPTGAAIGFHSIPTHDDVPLQTIAQLGTPQSHGCIRQDLPDAVALWNFAPVGTKVVVVA